MKEVVCCIWPSSGLGSSCSSNFSEALSTGLAIGTEASGFQAPIGAEGFSFSSAACSIFGGDESFSVAGGVMDLAGDEL